MFKHILFVLLGAVVLKVQSQPPADDPSCMQGNTKKIFDCCQIPAFVDQSIKSRCAAENPMIPPVPGVRKTEGCCMAQCMLTSLNAFKDNAIDKEAIKRALATTVGTDSNFSPLINGIVDECYDLVNSNPAFLATPVSSTAGRPGCSFMPEGFGNCVKSSFFQKCPVASWTESGECNQLKQKITSGCSIVSLMG